MKMDFAAQTLKFPAAAYFAANFLRRMRDFFNFHPETADFPETAGKAAGIYANLPSKPQSHHDLRSLMRDQVRTLQGKRSESASLLWSTYLASPDLTLMTAKSQQNLTQFERCLFTIN
jgi:hypothetical protein